MVKTKGNFNGTLILNPDFTTIIIFGPLILTASLEDK